MTCATTLQFILTTILPRAGLQDLTGQVIARVNDLFEKCRQKTVHLLLLLNAVDSNLWNWNIKRKEIEHDDTRGHGPLINNKQPEY